MVGVFARCLLRCDCSSLRRYVVHRYLPLRFGWIAVGLTLFTHCLSFGTWTDPVADDGPNPFDSVPENGPDVGRPVALTRATTRTNSHLNALAPSSGASSPNVSTGGVTRSPSRSPQKGKGVNEFTFESTVELTSTVSDSSSQPDGDSEVPSLMAGGKCQWGVPTVVTSADHDAVGAPFVDASAVGNGVSSPSARIGGDGGGGLGGGGDGNSISAYSSAENVLEDFTPSVSPVFAVGDVVVESDMMDGQSEPVVARAVPEALVSGKAGVSPSPAAARVVRAVAKRSDGVPNFGDDKF